MYSFGLGKRLIAIAYLSASKDEAVANSGWAMINQSIFLNNTNKDFPELTLRNGEVLNGRALRLVRPSYPSGSLNRFSGSVKVLVTIGEDGKVVSATAVSGNPAFHPNAVKAASQSTFPPTLICGQPTRISGTIMYNFAP